MELGKYEVDSVEIKTGRLLTSVITAVSCEDALQFERRYFGYPYFKVLRARPHLTKQIKATGISPIANSK